MLRLVAKLLAQDSDYGPLLERVNAQLRPEVRVQWLRVLKCRQQQLAPQQERGLWSEALREAAEAGAEAWLHANARATRGKTDKRARDDMDAAEEEAWRLRDRAAAVGALPSCWPDVAVPETALRASRGQIKVVATTAEPAERAAALPRRAELYEPEDRQSREQLQRIKELGLERAATGAVWYFTVGALNKIVCAWKQQGGQGQPPASVLRGAMHTKPPTSCASPTGHVWALRGRRAAATVAPLDAGQMAWVADLPGASVMRDMVRRQIVTESQLRSLVGQGTDGGSVASVVRRATARLRERPAWRGDKTVATLGAGMNLTGMQLVREVGGSARLAWMAEACPIAQPAGEAFARGLGHQPQVFGRAEHPDLATRQMRVWAEIITLRCAPWSPASAAYYPRGVEAALTELERVLRGVAARNPQLVIYENTDGLWQHPQDRARVEGLLQDLVGYEWEAALVRAVGSERTRVFYMGVWAA